MSGTLDKSFGTNGYTSNDFGGVGSTITNFQVIDSNNCTIVTGYTKLDNQKNILYLAKYTNAGFLDKTFGGGKGYVLGEYYPDGNSTGESIILDSTGNIIVTGAASNTDKIDNLLLARYKSNGDLDKSFGGGKGWLTSNLGYSSDYRSGVLSSGLDSSGSIIVTGNITKNSLVGANVLFLVAKYMSDGSIDTTFGGDGKGFVNITDLNQYYGKSLVIDTTNDSIIIYAQYPLAPNFYNPILVKLTKNGILDKNFGNNNGYLSISFGTDYRGSNGGFIKLDQENRILLVSDYNIYGSSSFDLLLARFDIDSGSLDNSFGENTGYTVTTIPNYNSSSISLALDNKNRIIVTGYIENETIYNTLLARYSGSGILDTTFGQKKLGYSIYTIGGDPSKGINVSIDTNNLIVVSGQISLILFIARFFNDPPVPTTTTTTHRQPICLVAGTPILTDQGSVPIELINPKKHTIAQKRIVAITQTITPEKYLVCFEANSIGINCPSQRTLMTPGHEVLYNGKLIQAKYFVGRLDGVHTVLYNGKDVLYNVLQETHGLMRVNNMILETLHPENKVAKQILNKEL